MIPTDLRSTISGCLALVLGAFMATAAPVSGSAQHSNGPASVADLADELIDSVVNISTSQTVTGRPSVPRPQLPDGSPFQEFFDEFFNRDGNNNGGPGANRPSRRVQSLGSGFVIDADEGLVVTNNHVIEDADEIVVNFADGGKLDAEVIGRDEKTDLAVLKVDASARQLTAAELGDSSAMRVGDWVMAIGNPFGLGGTVTLGIVSAVNRDINSGPYDNFLQTDASINRGNSGGPLFNMDGEVIGVNTAIISPSGGSIGIGFSVPTATAENVIAQLLEFGETRRGWLGVRIQEVTDEIADGLQMDEARGALIAGIASGGPAEAAGLEQGDVVLEFDGRSVPEMRDLPRMVADAPVGKDVEVLVLRKGEEVVLNVELGRLEEGEKLAAAEADGMIEESPLAASVEVLGLTLSELTDALREEHDISDAVDGVVITDVDPDSAAAEKRIVAGDVIVEVAQEGVLEPSDVVDKVAELEDEDRRAALLLLANESGDVRFVAVRLD